jgi:hypothetical protein
MKTPAVKYGFITLIITIVWTMIKHVLGYNTTKHEIGQYARMVGAVIFYITVFMAVYATRKQQGGSLTFGEGFKAGAIVTVIYSLGVAVWYALYGEVINTQYKPTLLAFERAKLEAAHATPEAIAAKLKEVDMTSGGTVMSYLFLIFFMSLFGFVLTIIASLIFKRKK